MKRFLTKVFVFFIFLIVTDIIVGQYIKQLPNFEVDDRLEKILEGKINSNIIITGSSVGARGILAEKITDETSFSAYNLSYPGSDITFHEFIIKNYIANNTVPQKILLTVDEVIFKADRSLKFRLDRCYPLLKYPVIKKIVAHKEQKNKYLAKYSNLYMFKREMLKGVKKRFSKYDTIWENGSMPLTFQKKAITQELKQSKPYSINNELKYKIKAFKNIISLAKAHNIELVLVFPPQYKIINASFVSRLKEIYQGKYVYVDNQTKDFQDKKLFSDKAHLNIKGAELFTKHIINNLKLR